jgi:hypothetical protein
LSFNIYLKGITTKIRYEKLPHEFEDQYVKEILYNTSLQNLPAEDWKLIEGC